MGQDNLNDLTLRLRQFAADREWEPFHSPKNLAMATSGEVGELVAEFQWLTEEGSRKLDPERLERVKLESADVLICLVMLADRLGFDLIEAANRKIQSNAERYPVEKARGNAKKYTEF